MMEPEPHTIIERWFADDFPFDHRDPAEVAMLNEVLPTGYWLASEITPEDDEELVYLFRNDRHYDGREGPER